jgi:Flp pilus assembly protein TadG
MDCGGGVGMMFTLLLVPLTAFVGLAVDFSRVYSVRYATQAALDTAALAAGRVAQVEAANKLAKASAAATAYFDQAKPTNVVNSTLEFSPNAAETEFTVTATSWVKTPFLSALNILYRKAPGAAAPPGCKSYYSCIVLINTATAELKVGGNGGENLEISLMLDVTGSMLGQKLADLKTAAKDLIDIVVWDDQSEYTAKVALVPFSQAVNVGKTYFKAVTGLEDDPDPDGDGYNYPSNCYNRRGRLKNSCRNNSEYKAKTYSPCVVERTGQTAFTDAPPSTRYLNALDEADPGVDCKPSSAEIVPLTDDKSKLNTAIDRLAADGYTAGHLGTAWAWYLLSPAWRDVWPAGSKPAHYGTPNLNKIAVLMTDGEYNAEYYRSQNGSASAQARSLCSNMKAEGIEVYAVGFDLGGNSTAINTLKHCATDASHFYETSTGDQLRAAFRDIALKVSTLRLTN